MKKIRVCKHDPMGKEVVPGVSIEIDNNIPDMFKDDSSLDLIERFYDDQAEEVHEALKKLPGGVWTRLLGKMLAERDGHLTVSLFK